MAEPSETRRLAVLIDADNTSVRYAASIFDEIASLGEANVRRIYGDFSGARLGVWDSAVQSLAILQHQQRSNTTGKNAADIALVIDAMDLLYKGTLDGFCIVSSDSDFTRLTQRLREDGLAVYGFGERKTPEAFRNACTRFIYVENLIEAAEPLSVPGQPSGAIATDRERKKEPASKSTAIIRKAMAGLEDDEGWATLAGVGSRIANVAPDFDPRSYGHTKLSALAESTGDFEVKRSGDKHIMIRPKRSSRKHATK